MSVTKPQFAYELSGAHLGCTIEVLGDPHPTKPWMQERLAVIILGSVSHHGDTTCISPAGDPENSAEIPAGSSIRVVAGGPQMISDTDRSYLAEWAQRVRGATLDRHGHHYLPVPAVDAARIWRIRASIESQVDGLTDLVRLLAHMDGHNCGVCGKPDDDSCILNC